MVTSVVADNVPATGKNNNSKVPDVDQVLSQVKKCSDTVNLRSQALTPQMQQQACDILLQQEAFFHETFKTEGKPVKHDFNRNLRANIYHTREDYIKYAGHHFNIPTDNGGMYLEGYPDIPGNQAEFIAYEKEGQIWNLQHEYVHYLDGRYNLYGDFCLSLHDSHSPPENCVQPAPVYPHTVWWSEGLGEYIVHPNHYPKTFATLKKELGKYKLSEIFNTSYSQNGGSSRVYSWGYAAVRFMIENHRKEIEDMLKFTRAGDYARYQALVKNWGNRFDQEFEQWLKEVTSNIQLAEDNNKKKQ